MELVEKALTKVEESPWAQMYRVAVGAVVPPLGFALLGPRPSALALVILLLSILALTRIVPALLRRLLPFTDEARDLWRKRRMLAKKYDSYQWRKLTWIGVGLGIQAVLVGSRREALAVLSSVCCLAGILGSAVWRIRRRAERIAERAQ
jgi:hypothetical protein